MARTDREDGMAKLTGRLSELNPLRKIDGPEAARKAANYIGFVGGWLTFQYLLMAGLAYFGVDPLGGDKLGADAGGLLADVGINVAFAFAAALIGLAARFKRWLWAVVLLAVWGLAEGVFKFVFLVTGGMEGGSFGLMIVIGALLIISAILGVRGRLAMNRTAPQP